MSLLDMPERYASQRTPPQWQIERFAALRIERAAEEFDANAPPFIDWCSDLAGNDAHEAFVAAALEHYRRPTCEDASVAFTNAADKLKDAYVAWRSERQDLYDDVAFELDDEGDDDDQH